MIEAEVGTLRLEAGVIYLGEGVTRHRPHAPGSTTPPPTFRVFRVDAVTSEPFHDHLAVLHSTLVRALFSLLLVTCNISMSL